MPRKRKKPADTPAAEPTSVAEALEQSPIARILASHEAKAKIEPEHPVPEPEPQPSHVERLSRRVTGMQPVPSGFRSVGSYPVAGMRVNRSDDKSIAAIQFAEEWRASRDGLKSEIDTLEIRGFRYEPLRRQWEREDRERPGANIVDASQLGAELAKARAGREL